MRIVHTEASLGWGGQEIRTFNEAKALREKGHEIFFIIQKGAKLAQRCTEEGFAVLEVNFFKKHWPLSLLKMIRFLNKIKAQLVVTHSSLDGWLGGISARLAHIPVIRIRHVSTPTKSGLNAKILFNLLADHIITTSSEIVASLERATGKNRGQIVCIPTGVDPSSLHINLDEVKAFRASLGLAESDCLAGSVCVVRSWKGIESLIGAAEKLRNIPDLKWLVVGGGYLEQHQKRVQRLGLEKQVIFTGHLNDPKVALAALDIFLLLSTANEGISQASLQASYMEKPLVTTPTGGLKEVCLHEQTGLLVAPHSAEEVAEAVMKLKVSPELRTKYGRLAKALIEERFLFEKTLKEIEDIYMRFSC